MPNIKLGIDRIGEYHHIFKDKKVGLVTNPTGVDGRLVSAIDILFEKTNLTALYSPEHGVRGDIQAGEKVEDYIDESTGIKVFTLYGKNKKPTKEVLDAVDILVIDIQDVGSRLYTYLYTMAYCMQSAKEYGKEIVVLDRPNPLGGEVVEGNLVKQGFTSFIGLYPIPYRYGLTIGELANFFNDEFEINCDLTVIPMEGWTRDMHYEDTGLEWILPSPNMPTVDTAFAYNATCIFEGTNISEGRGTTKPFEFVGAPWLDAEKLTKTMNGKGLSGVAFRPAYFTPTFSKHTEELCKGVQLHILDRESFNATETSLHLLSAIKGQNPGKFEYTEPYTESGKHMMDYNTGSDYIRTNNFNPVETYKQWQEEADTFKEQKQAYHIY